MTGQQKPRPPFQPKRTLNDHDMAWNLAISLDNHTKAFRSNASQALLRKTDETLRHVDDAIESLYAVAKDLQ